MSPPDPVFPALDRYRAAAKAYTQACGQLDTCPEADRAMVEADIDATARDAWLGALDALYRTRPTTLAGLDAFVRVFEAEDGHMVEELGPMPALAVRTLLQGIRELAAQPRSSEGRDPRT